jgi:predicted RNA-binding Zn-ribbon protein involved in translation (DUF1610 family)
MVRNGQVYKCEKCDYTTTRRSNFNSHCARKTQCYPKNKTPETVAILHDIPKEDNDLNKYICPTCNKQFATRQSKFRHIRLNKCLESSENELKKRVGVLEQKLQSMNTSSIVANTTNNTMNTNNNTNNIQVNISVCDYGKENMSYIDNNFLLDCLLACQKQEYLDENEEHGIKRLIEHIHCNAEHPENWNVRIKNLNRNLVERRQNGTWIVADKNKTIDDMVSKCCKIMKRFNLSTIEDIDDRFDGITDDIAEFISLLETGDRATMLDTRRDITLKFLAMAKTMRNLTEQAQALQDSLKSA